MAFLFALQQYDLVLVYNYICIVIYNSRNFIYIQMSIVIAIQEENAIEADNY